MKTAKTKLWCSGVFTLLLLAAGSRAAIAADALNPKALIQENCAEACHADDKGKLQRIETQRKTPEGWLMTIVRMQRQQGVQLNDDERRALVKYFADHQGLAPSETAPVRYAMEQRLNTIESFDGVEPLQQMCARCHSGARFMLQRRTQDEWQHLVHFHVGQFPTLEYQSLSRDRDWFNIAIKETVPQLAKHYGFKSDAWQQWLKTKPPVVSGEWSVSGHLPGKGDFVASMALKETSKDNYSITLNGQYQDGETLTGSGNVILYTGYEWRGNLTVNGKKMRQVFAVRDDLLSGRMFYSDNDEVGADIVAARQQSGKSHIIAVQPGNMKVGVPTQLTIIGNNLAGKAVLPAGIKVNKVIERTPGRIVVEAVASKSAIGAHPVKVGATSGATLAVYEQIDRVAVVPAYAVARVGGDGGAMPKVDARFEAEAWAKGPKGEYKIGIVPATWKVAPFNADAVRDRDIEFAGSINAITGVFVPAVAGPNPKRHLSTNNAGNLAVIATVADGNGKALDAQGQLIVTVQRWVNAPLP